MFKSAVVCALVYGADANLPFSWFGGFQQNAELPSPYVHDDGSCSFIDYDELSRTLKSVQQEDNGGFGFNMWASVVSRTGVVCAVARSGETSGDQWPGSRAISAEKANSANAFSLPDFAISTGNFYQPSQSGGFVYGIQTSNPVDPTKAYAGAFEQYGTARDALVGKKMGGLSVIAGGLALYGEGGDLLGGLGVSGDSSCADHVIAWKMRDAMDLDYVPAGLNADGTDNIITPASEPWGQPACGGDSVAISKTFPTTYPIKIQE